MTPHTSHDPAARSGRMFAALAALAALGVLSWYTLDPSAVVHMRGSAAFGIADRDVPVRWFPVALLCVFALRVVLANARARVESRRRQPDV